MWHFVCIERRPYLVANEKQSGFRVVDNAMNLLWFKFVEDGHCHGAITQCGQNATAQLAQLRPQRAMRSPFWMPAFSNMMCSFQSFVQHLCIGACCPCSQSCVKIPMSLDSLFYISDEIFVCFHVWLKKQMNRKAHCMCLCAKVRKITHT